jgi:hypothetical protein
MEVAGISESQ